MTVPFTNTPSGNGIKTPLFYAEMDNSAASFYSQTLVALLIGTKLTSGAATADNPIILNGGVDAANTLFGKGSELARMVKAFRDSNPTGMLYCLPVAEPSGGVAATSTITVTGPATAAGTISLYIAGQLVNVAVASSDSASAVATAIVTAITADGDLPVTAAALAGVVTLTAKWKGLTGNDITVKDSYLGTVGGQSLPAGIALAYAAGTAGTSAPTLTTALAALGDDQYDFIVTPWTDATTLTAISTLMNDTSGRWSYNKQQYGHVYSAKRDTLANLTTFGGALNNQHFTVAAVDADTLAPIYEYAAAYAAANAVGISSDAFRPTQTLPLIGLMAPRRGKRFLQTEREALLNYGIATSFVDSGGTIRVERAITTYQKNAFGTLDPSYFDSETMHQSAEFIRRARSIITNKYPRHKVANNGTTFGNGQAIVTPAVVEAELDSLYLAMVEEGKLENYEAWKANRFAERDANNPNRINFLATPDYVNQLRVFAFLNQFRLQFPT